MKYIEVRMTKTTLYFTEAELSSLLAANKRLWQEAIRRGKMIKRAKTKREAKVCEKINPPF